MGLNTAKKWDRLETFSGKIAENVTQAIARDLLFYSMQTLCCYFMVATVHDEIIIEADKRMSVDAVCEQMGRVPPWAKGLILKADGYECDFYQKN
jgi:DNA polymerase